MNTTKTISYKSSGISIDDLRNTNAHSLANPALDRLRELYFLHDHKIPTNDLDFGHRLIRTTYVEGKFLSRIPKLEQFSTIGLVKETVAFFTISITTKSSVSSYVPSNQLIKASRFDPYMPVAWVREFAHDPWEDPKLCVDWLIFKVKSYSTDIPDKIVVGDADSERPKEIIWRVPETYLDLQKILLGKGFIIESYNQRTKKFSFSLILA